MAINIFEIQPSVVSRDLSEKSFLIYGEKKSGKTSNAVKFPRPLLLGFEKGWNALSGVIAVPINSWSETKSVKKQLLQNAKEVKEGKKEDTTFKTVIMDTSDIAYDMCEKFILAKEGVEYLDETENKRGYKATEKEFEEFIVDIIKAGYTFVAISHSEVKQFKDEKGQKYDRIIPTVPKRGLKILARTVDIIGYSRIKTMEDGSTKTMLLMRGSESVEAGSRWVHTSEEIEFTYKNLLDDIIQAIDKQESEGALVVDKKDSIHKDTTSFDYEALMEEIKALGVKFAENGKLNELTSIVEKHLGIGRKVTECTVHQVEVMATILEDLKDREKEISLAA